MQNGEVLSFVLVDAFYLDIEERFRRDRNSGAGRDEGGEPIDLGHVGRVTRVDRDTIENLCYAGQVPVIPSMCETDTGERLNVNADTAASACARNTCGSISR